MAALGLQVPATAHSGVHSSSPAARMSVPSEAGSSQERGLCWASRAEVPLGALRSALLCTAHLAVALPFYRALLC